MSDETAGRAGFGFTAIVVQPIARSPVRRREDGHTLAAWRLEMSCDQGRGGIVQLDIGAGDLRYRGDGVFLGWPQDRLAEAYLELTKPDGSSSDDVQFIQLG